MLLFIGGSLAEFSKQITGEFGKMAFANIQHAALALAGLFALYVLLQVSVKLFSGQSFPWQEVLRPFAIIVAISFWEPLISTVDNAGEYISDSIGNAFEVEENSRVVVEEIGKSVKKIDEGADAIEEKQETKDGLLMRFFRRLSHGVVMQLVAGASNAMSFAPSFIGSILFSIMVPVMTILSQLYITVLKLIGPFAFAFAVVPGFNRVTTWLGAYIQYALWVPLLTLVNSFNVRLCSMRNAINGAHAFIWNIGEDGVMADSFKLLSDNVTDFTSALNYINFVGWCSWACLFLLFTIPKIASLVVHSGQDVMTGTLSRGAMMVAQAAKKGL